MNVILRSYLRVKEQMIKINQKIKQNIINEFQ